MVQFSSGCRYHLAQFSSGCRYHLMLSVLLLLIGGCSTPNLSTAPESADPSLSTPTATEESPAPPSTGTDSVNPENTDSENTDSENSENTDPDTIITATSEPPVLTDALAALAQDLPITAQADIGGIVIQLEVASTPQQQSLGLMYRDELADDRGMVFPFANPRPVQFWMKNVFIHLDMVFLRDGIVQAVEANVPPCAAEPCPTYGPWNVVIDQVIELRGGRAAELGIAVGDRIQVTPIE